MRPAARAAEEFLSTHEVRKYKLGWKIFIRGTKICVGRIYPAAVGLARAINDICEWKQVLKKPRRPYRMSGKNKGWSTKGVRRSAAERREYLAKLQAEKLESQTRADPSDDVRDVV